MSYYVVSWNSKKWQRLDNSYVNIQDVYENKSEAEEVVKRLQADKNNFNIELTEVE